MVDAEAAVVVCRQALEEIQEEDEYDSDNLSDGLRVQNDVANESQEAAVVVYGQVLEEIQEEDEYDSDNLSDRLRVQNDVVDESLEQNDD